MSAQPVPAPRVVRPHITARERLARIVSYHELLVGMVRKELKVKYKNSVLGFAWSLLNPLLYLVVFYIAFEKILGSSIPSFPIYLLSGLLVWNLFSMGLSGATNSVVANASLVKKVAFPREILPLSSVGSTLVHFFLQSLVLFTVLAIARWHVAWAYMPLLPVALVALLLVTGSLGILLSATNVYLRDTQHFLELALLAWFWVTPIVYPFQLVARKAGWFRWVWAANPITPIVLVFQRAIFGKLDNPHVLKDGHPTPLLPHWSYASYVEYLGIAFAFGIIMLILGVYVFGRSEANFAEEL
ncbi:MAG TPA: ABC transporter permease [Acidimicrobiia bacterium]|nr:ABC transporter permease [Acidimicrobiia bacterium]